MKTSEVLAKLHISPMTLNNYVKAGKIKVKYKYSDKLFVYDDQSVEDFLKSTQLDKNSAVKPDGMRAREVLDLLGVTAPTLGQYVKAGKIKIQQKLSKRMFIYDRESVMKFLEDCKCN